jgi:hypothetical protein
MLPENRGEPSLVYAKFAENELGSFFIHLVNVHIFRGLFKVLVKSGNIMLDEKYKAE